LAIYWNSSYKFISEINWYFPSINSADYGEDSNYMKGIKVIEKFVEEYNNKQYYTVIG